jgi:hypothetical protein
VNTDAWIQLIIYFCSLCTTIGTIISKINSLEKKVDKHNSIVERITILEQRFKVDHERLNEILKIWREE